VIGVFGEYECGLVLGGLVLLLLVMMGKVIFGCMCGIVGYIGLVGGVDVFDVVFEGLWRMEYCGYDLVGVVI